MKECEATKLDIRLHFYAPYYGKTIERSEIEKWTKQQQQQAVEKNHEHHNMICVRGRTTHLLITNDVHVRAYDLHKRV